MSLRGRVDEMAATRGQKRSSEDEARETKKLKEAKWVGQSLPGRDKRAILMAFVVCPGNDVGKAN